MQVIPTHGTDVALGSGVAAAAAAGTGPSTVASLPERSCTMVAD